MLPEIIFLLFFQIASQPPNNGKVMRTLMSSLQTELKSLLESSGGLSDAQRRDAVTMKMVQKEFDAISTGSPSHLDILLEQDDALISGRFMSISRMVTVKRWGELLARRRVSTHQAASGFGLEVAMAARKSGNHSAANKFLGVAWQMTRDLKSLSLTTTFLSVDEASALRQAAKQARAAGDEATAVQTLSDLAANVASRDYYNPTAEDAELKEVAARALNNLAQWGVASPNTVWQLMEFEAAAVPSTPDLPPTVGDEHPIGRSVPSQFINPFRQ